MRMLGRHCERSFYKRRIAPVGHCVPAIRGVQPAVRLWIFSGLSRPYLSFGEGGVSTEIPRGYPSRSPIIANAVNRSSLHLPSLYRFIFRQLVLGGGSRSTYWWDSPAKRGIACHSLIDRQDACPTTARELLVVSWGSFLLRLDGVLRTSLTVMSQKTSHRYCYFQVITVASSPTISM